MIQIISSERFGQTHYAITQLTDVAKVDKKCSLGSTITYYGLDGSIRIWNFIPNEVEGQDGQWIEML